MAAAGGLFGAHKYNDVNVAVAGGLFGLQRYDDAKIGEDEASVNDLPEASLLLLRHKNVYVTLPDGTPLNYPVFVKIVSAREAERAKKYGDEHIGPPVYRTSFMGSSKGRLLKFQIVMLKFDGDAIDIFEKAVAPVERTFTTMYRVAERVAKLHRVTFHGDIKGSNVAVSGDPADCTGKDDDVRLIDLGSSREYTPEYCSPDILRSRLFDPGKCCTEEVRKKGDVYALGIMMIAHLAHRHILRPDVRGITYESLEAMLELRGNRAMITEEVAGAFPEDCPHRSVLIPLLVRTLSPNPDERQTAREFAATLFGLLPTETQEQMRERGFVLEGDERPLAAPGEENGAPSFGGSASASASP